MACLGSEERILVVVDKKSKKEGGNNNGRGGGSSSNSQKVGISILAEGLIKRVWISWPTVHE